MRIFFLSSIICNAESIVGRDCINWSHFFQSAAWRHYGLGLGSTSNMTGTAHSCQPCAVRDT